MSIRTEEEYEAKHYKIDLPDPVVEGYKEREEIPRKVFFGQSTNR